MALRKSTRINHEKRLRPVLTYIDSHLHQHIALETLSEIANLSSFHFHRVFKRHMGENVSEYITRLKLEHSAQLLLHTDKTTTEISHAIGYSNAATFCRAFKQRYQLSHSEYRSKMRNAFIGPEMPPILSKNLSLP